MTKFKVGDKVILNKEFHDKTIYEIKEVMFIGERVVLNNNLGYPSKYFKKIKER